MVLAVVMVAAVPAAKGGQGGAEPKVFELLHEVEVLAELFADDVSNYC